MQPSATQTAWELGTIAQWAGVCATVLAVFVALFKDELIRIWRKPRLDVVLSLSSPHSHKTIMDLRTNSAIAASAECYYLRAWIENKGKVRAEQVQVFMAQLSRKGADGLFREVKEFLPMNLKWSYTGDVFTPGISPSIGRHCDFAHIIDPAFRKAFGEDCKGDLIPPGTYLIKLRVAGSNTSKPVNKEYEMVITGNWFSDESRMFSEGISIKAT
jgi:hypothetical protein